MGEEKSIADLVRDAVKHLAVFRARHRYHDSFYKQVTIARLAKAAHAVALAVSRSNEPQRGLEEFIALLKSDDAQTLEYASPVLHSDNGACCAGILYRSHSADDSLPTEDTDRPYGWRSTTYFRPTPDGLLVLAPLDTPEQFLKG